MTTGKPDYAILREKQFVLLNVRISKDLYSELMQVLIDTFSPPKLECIREGYIEMWIDDINDLLEDEDMSSRLLACLEGVSKDTGGDLFSFTHPFS